MSIFTSAIGCLRLWRRERTVDKREITKSLAIELDNLAELMSELLLVTEADGQIKQEKLEELEILRQRVWSGWVTILGTSGYASQDPELQAEIEKCISIAHAAPGAYVEELYLAQIGMAKGRISHEVRGRFAKSIHNIQDLTTRMRLNA